jgi:cytochrome c oxidase cbb3-type subunit 3
MSKRDVDDVSGTETTGHEWDGIRELDTPLPRWWLYIFYATIAFSVVYWVMMPAWPGLNGYTRGLNNHSDRANVAKDVAELKTLRSEGFQTLMATSPADVAANPELLRFATAAGASAFGDNCATCHGFGGAGAKGYPTLADNVWLWDGTFAGIEQTIKYGIRSNHPDTRLSIMPSYGRDDLLSDGEIADVTEYVVQLGGGPADAAKATRGAAVFAAQCTSCHGETGLGDRAQGAPNLTDAEWLKAGPAASNAKDWKAIRGSILTQMEVGGGGVMQAWGERLDPETVRALAIYVHSLGGGEPDPAPAPVDPAPVDPAATPQPTSGDMPAASPAKPLQ